MAWTPRKGYSTAQRKAILKRDPVCMRCGLKPSTQADHIVAVAEGGQHTLANGQGLCEPCHDDKTRAESARGTKRWNKDRRPRQRRMPEKHPGVINL